MQISTGYKTSTSTAQNRHQLQRQTSAKTGTSTNASTSAKTGTSSAANQHQLRPKPAPAPAAKPAPAPASAQDTSISAIEKAVLDLTNAERQKAGLKPLQTDSALMNSARQKSTDMATNNYFSHTSPTYGSPFDQMKAIGISYNSAAENIAMGQRTAEEVVKAWMESPGHRENIMDS